MSLTITQPTWTWLVNHSSTSSKMSTWCRHVTRVWRPGVKTTRRDGSQLFDRPNQCNRPSSRSTRSAQDGGLDGDRRRTDQWQLTINAEWVSEWGREGRIAGGHSERIDDNRSQQRRPAGNDLASDAAKGTWVSTDIYRPTVTDGGERKHGRGTSEIKAPGLDGMFVVDSHFMSQIRLMRRGGNRLQWNEELTFRGSVGGKTKGKWWLEVAEKR